jgi:multidrug resistance efflux pump
MATEWPKLREDLILSEQAEDGTPCLVVKDPQTGRFYRFREVEAFILGQLDGRASLTEIRGRVLGKYHSDLPAEALTTFLQRLGELGLLAPEGGEQPASGPVQGKALRRRRNPLFIRLKVFDPDHLLSYLAPRLGFFFTRPFIFISALLIFLAVLVVIGSWEDLLAQLSRLYQPKALLIIWVSLFFVIAAHEFAHGVTCKRFGGEVHEMGFLLLFFQPAFYCNVTDAWLFKERSQRLWVTFAGGYFELFLWALAVLLWRLADPDTWLSTACLAVMVSSGISTLFNLNPLIKLDGYYLLSDYLRIPNLRAKAFGYLASLIGMSSGSAEEVSPRERRVYLIYGTLAWGYSLLLLGVVGYGVASLLVGRLQGLGFILFIALVLLIFHGPIGKLLSGGYSLLRIGEGVRTRMKKALKILGPVAAILLLLYFWRSELSISADFHVLPTENAEVRAEVEGIIEEIYVDEGKMVKQGDLIARLDDRDLRQELRKVEAAIVQREAKLRMLKAGPREEEIEKARNAVATATARLLAAQRRYEEAKRLQKERRGKAQESVEKVQVELEYARKALEKMEPLYLDKGISWLQYQEAKRTVEVKRKELEEARADQRALLADDLAELQSELPIKDRELEESKSALRMLLAGSRLEEIEAMKAEVAELVAGRDRLQERLALTEVRSPAAGVVATPRLKERVGEYVKRGDLICKVYEFHSVEAEIPVSEKEIADVKVGQGVKIKAHAYPDRSFYGKVVSIAPALGMKDQTQGPRNLSSNTIMVTTIIENPDLLLKPGMTGNAKIFAGQRKTIELLTRRIARVIKVEVWSWF